MLSHSEFEDGVVVVKICVLISPKLSPLKFCNIRSPFGLWCQNLLKVFGSFGCSSVIMDSPLFFHTKTIQFGSGGIESSFDRNAELFVWRKNCLDVSAALTSPTKTTFIPEASTKAPHRFVPSSKTGCVNGSLLNNSNDDLPKGMSSAKFGKS